MAKLLITDDDAHLRKLVTTYAELEGHICVEAQNGQEALAALRRNGFGLVILDVMMPGMDGFELLAELRKTSQVPVIMLTARGEEYDKLQGFDLGADDYCPKPFSPKELMARVKAVLKRSGGEQDEVLTFGKLSIDRQARSVTLNENPLNMTPKEFDLLVKLAQNEHIVLTRDQLLESVWGYDYDGDTRTVDTHIKSLRDRLGEYRGLINTVWGVGYKFEYRE